MKIVAINGMASVQDLGRFGQRGFGIGVAGAMDSWAVKAGNALLDNPDDTPAIELTLGGLTVTLDDSDVDATTGELAICLTGALYEAYLTDHAGQRQRMPNGWRVTVRAGDTLELVRAVQGMHGYLCVQGGFAIPKVLGSASTHAKAEFGGYHGRLLQVGDNLPLARVERAKLPRVGMASFIEPLATSSDLPIIRVLKNSEYAAFTPTAIHAFTEQPYKLLSSSNRMGYRLEGASELALNEPLQMNSHGVDVGMIQVPPQGQPIVLMADTQTTGGYPKIASIIQADIGRFAQLRFGQACRFAWVDLDTAIHARSQRERYLDKIRQFV